MLSDHDIEAVNVRPTFEASLHFGATEEELRERIGWTREILEKPGATVSGASTYAHMELMHGKADFPEFVLAATELHGPASLGVVGLACKTAATVGEMIECHQRFQHLTNRTAQYASRIEEGVHVLSERRDDEASHGSRLVSDYTMFVALHLLRVASMEAPKVLSMRSRRQGMNAVERRHYEDFLGAPLELGAANAELMLDESIRSAKVQTADVELSAYFRGVLEKAARFSADEPALLCDVRLAIRDALVRGTPTATQIAHTLGLGQRTLQRRLANQQQTYAQVLESTRRSLVEGYLKNPTLSIAEIGYLVGYSEQASFFRAFRSWHGVTPTEYRLRLT